LNPLFYHVEDIVAFKLMIISNKSLSNGMMLAKYTTKDDQPFQEINFLKANNWAEYLKNNSLCTAYDSHILLSTKKQNNIQKLLRYVPQEYQKEYEFAVPKETTNTATELRESMLAIQNINLEDNNHTETERETPTSSIKQSIPFLLQTLRGIAEK